MKPTEQQQKLWPFPVRIDYGQGMEAWRENVTSWMRSLAECGSEVSRFVSTRLHSDFEAWQNLARCRTINDVVSYQAIIMQKMACDYLEEAGRLFQLFTRAELGVTPAAEPQAPSDEAAKHAHVPRARAAE